MKIYASLWGNYDESAQSFYETADVTDVVDFGTQLHGGFSTCSFTIGGARDRSRWKLRRYLNAHVVLHDAYGRRIYEGYVVSAGSEQSGLKLGCLGYYDKARNVIFDLIYPSVEATENRTVNPSFEVNVTDGWTANTATGGAVVRNTDNHYVGSASAKITQPTAGTLEFYCTDSSVTDETAYAFTLWAKNLDLDGTTPIMFILQSPGSELSEYKLSNLSDTSFIRFELTVTLAVGTTSVTYGVKIDEKTEAKSFFIDAVQFEEKPYSTTYADGSLGWLHSWQGTAHNSKSTRTAWSASTSLVVSDCIEIIPEWTPKYAFVATSDYLVGYQDFTDRKVKDALESVLKFGYKEADVRPIYFAIWEHRIPHLIPEPDNTSFPDWLISTSSMLGGKEGVSVSMDGIYNKVYAVYDDQGYGQSKTLPAEDYFSQQRYGVIEGKVENGENPEGIALAEDLRDMALSKFKYPRQVLSLEIAGFVKHSSGHYDYPYRIRAGQQILIVDGDLLTVHAGTLGGQVSTGLSGFVVRTEYSGNSHSVRIDLGLSDVTFELLMSRLGLSGGLS